MIGEEFSWQKKYPSLRKYETVLHSNGLFLLIGVIFRSRNTPVSWERFTLSVVLLVLIGFHFFTSSYFFFHCDPLPVNAIYC